MKKSIGGIENLRNNPGLQVQEISTGALHVSGISERIKLIKERAKEIEDQQFVNSDELIEEGRKKGLVQGIVLAINYMYRSNDEVAIWKAAGLTVQECIDNECDSYDMEMILKHRKELER